MGMCLICRGVSTWSCLICRGVICRGVSTYSALICRGVSIIWQRRVHHLPFFSGSLQFRMVFKRSSHKVARSHKQIGACRSVGILLSVHAHEPVWEHTHINTYTHIDTYKCTQTHLQTPKNTRTGAILLLTLIVIANPAACFAPMPAGGAMQPARAVSSRTLRLNARGVHGGLHMVASDVTDADFKKIVIDSAGGCVVCMYICIHTHKRTPKYTHTRSTYTHTYKVTHRCTNTHTYNLYIRAYTSISNTCTHRNNLSRACTHTHTQTENRRLPHTHSHPPLFLVSAFGYLD